MGATLAAVLRKDLLLELRTRESVGSMALFSIMTFVVFHFALDRRSVEGDLASGVLWITVLFSAILGINRLFVADDEQGGFDAFLLAPVDRGALFVAKALALLAFLAAVQTIAVPAFAVLLLGPSVWPALPGLLAVLALADLGICVVGTLVGTIAVRSRARELIVALLALPLLIPVLIAAAQLTAPLLAQAGAGALQGRWLATLALYDGLFATIAYAVFEPLLED
ncbi:MAG: heme exporter protein CcmB [Solirubrobacterales bacterium]|nr:heme exporter protein CcmB [Solirubrobacterales bacterium]